MMPDFIRSMNREVQYTQDAGGLLSDLHDPPFMLRRLTNDLGTLGDYLDELEGFSPDSEAMRMIEEHCVKIATWALCVAIRRKDDAKQQT